VAHTDTINTFRCVVSGIEKNRAIGKCWEKKFNIHFCLYLLFPNPTPEIKLLDMSTLSVLHPLAAIVLGHFSGNFTSKKLSFPLIPISIPESLHCLVPSTTEEINYKT
jgi:hypothetical protein